MKNEPWPFEFDAPTRVPEILEALVASRIVQLKRYSHLSANVPSKIPLVDNHDLFLDSTGPVVVELDNGAIVGAYSDDTETGSVVLRFERDTKGRRAPNYCISSDPSYQPIDGCDPIYSNEEVCEIVGCTILSVIVLKDKDNILRPEWPCEVAVRLLLDNSNELALCHGLPDSGSDDFTVRTKSRIPSGYFDMLTEILRL